ncbi:glycosyltransferase [Leptospira fletcheri]|uniref:Glycosyltransferase n=1 Tax=Leptospira fletcheri TaxID=2484981 RepID=A0A4R9GDR3_9LEPT|nr:glycosyltransferase family 2 protein [Leptospira fletcheri]TGK09942.1 glycosyltransferase [Leptospira fletcheri]
MILPKIISIVTPSFNQDKYLERTVHSVLSQSGDFYLDYIIMDGGSTDSSREIIKKFETIVLSGKKVANFEGLEFYLPAKNLGGIGCKGVSYRWFSERDNGQADAINKGWSISKGSILGWLNSDDIYLENAFETVLKSFAKPDVFFIYGGSFHITVDDLIIQQYPMESYDRGRLVDYCYISQPAVFMRKEIIDKVGLLNQNLMYCMDYEYWLRISATIPLTFVNKMLACTRIHGETKTSSKMKVLSEIVRMQKALIGKVSRYWLDSYVDFWLTKKIKIDPSFTFLRRVVYIFFFVLFDVRFNYGRFTLKRIFL